MYVTIFFMPVMLLLVSVAAMVLVATCLYRWFFRASSLQALLAVHCLRFISPISLMPGATAAGLSTAFTGPQVIGDCATATFALVAVAALRGRWRHARAWVWATNLLGAADLTFVMVQGLRFDLADHVGAMFYVVVWLVPVLLVSHTAIFGRLTRRWPLEGASVG